MRVNVRLANDTVVLPDLMIILADRFGIGREWGIDGAPSLVAEIAWPHTDYRDRGIQREISALYGVPEYWLVEHEKHRVTVYSDPIGDQYRTQTVASDVAVSATIPGLIADLAPLLASIFDG